MLSTNNLKNHGRQLLGLTLATAVLTSLFAVTSYSRTRLRSSRIARTNVTPSSLPQPQTPALKFNGKIAFVSQRDNAKGEIYVMSSDGTNQTRLTNNQFFDYDPVFSPDGTKIAFFSQSDPSTGQFMSEIYVMNADGSNQNRLTNSPSGDSCPAWSPDGAKIAYIEGDLNINVVNIDGSGQVTIGQVPFSDSSCLAWSPDGTKIAFSASDIYFLREDIYLMNADGSNVRQLTQAYLFESYHAPAWSPDGAKLVFAYGNQNIFTGALTAEIRTMDADGNNQQVVTSANARGVSWSPDGQKIAFDGLYDIYVVNTDGSARFQLTNTGNNSDASWGPKTSMAPSGCPNPIDCADFFVRQQYLDFLNREPDTAGFTDWLSVLNGCGPNQGGLGSDPACDRVHVSSGFFRSPEFGERGYWLYRFFAASLGRRPQFAEFLPESQKLSGSLTASELAARKADFVARFMQLPEFTNIYAGLTDSAHAAQFIAKLEEKAHVTLPASATTDPGQPPQYGRQQLIDLMSSGQFTAAQTLQAFIEQRVVWDTYFYPAFVAMEYFGYLRRDPDTAGYNDWVDVLTNGRASAGIQPGDYRHLIFGFIYSIEYRQRFGAP